MPHDLPPPYETPAEGILPSFAAAQGEWPQQLVFRRCVADASVVNVAQSESPIAAAVLTITGFFRRISFQDFLLNEQYNYNHIYPGSTAGCTVNDLRLADLPFVARLMLPPLGSPEDHPKKQKFVYKGDDARRTVHYTVHDLADPSASAAGVEALFEIDGIKFRWVSIKNPGSPSSPTASSAANASGSSAFSSPPTSPALGSVVTEEPICHELQFESSVGANPTWTTVATTSVLRNKFYTTEIMHHGKTGVYGVRPVFATVNFAMEKMSWMNFSSSQLQVIVGVLWSLWMGDALNKEGRLAEIVAPRLKLYKKNKRMSMSRKN
ncbi:hypothetical protein HDU98_010513 [Podochytrium sp. JEL0797]|nr:hypothetical protein HDU98_010513 [Podochytrium sp. JEL0797]